MDISADGQVVILFHSQLNPESKPVEANRWCEFPSADMKFDITAEPPAGRELLVAIATRKPLDRSALRLIEVGGLAGATQLQDPNQGAKVFRVRVGYFYPE